MTYPAVPWPDWMEGPNGLLAKSADRSLGDQPESLAMHTWLVLSRLADQYRLRPWLGEHLSQPRLWHRLFWACVLHDFGKAARGFQQVLRGELDRWRQRHEVLSLAFVDWLFPPGHEDRLWIIAAIASHHKDASTIYERYLAETDQANQNLHGLPDELDETTITWLWRWLDECPSAWAASLGLTEVLEFPPLSPLSEPAQAIGVASIRRALDEYNNWEMQLANLYEPSPEVFAGLCLRGLIFAADHAASAHAGEFLPPNLTAEAALGGIPLDRQHDHQCEAAQAGAGSAILVAPTGSGKTEAALLWAARQAEEDGMPPPRLFYALPYQASMNAMHKRLGEEHFTGEQVGLQHGRAVQALYYDLLNADDTSPAEAAEQARRKRNLADLSLQPVRVFSPYQMLKLAYRLKGFEALLADYYGALFIFDEIHAYEPKRLALFVEMIGWLARHCRARFFIMTATLPLPVEEVLRDALPGSINIHATTAVYKQFQRHKLRLLDGELLSDTGLSAITDAVGKGMSVLICCNTVRRAQAIYRQLQERLPGMEPDEDIVLVHGRFNAHDRTRKETLIQERMSAGREQQGSRPMLVIATQVVEVSLNIDLDTIYTDPAPLDALLQRFGRVNRKLPDQRRGRLADVHVFREPADGQHVYSDEMVQASLRVLESINNEPIDESKVSALLGEVYTGAILDEWRGKYEASASDFRHILDQIRPFESAEKWLYNEFYRLFDGIEVLPLDMEEEYKRRREESKQGRKESHIEAFQLFVPMSWGQYQQLKGLRKAWPKGEPPEYYLADVPYSPEIGLDLDAARGDAPADTEDY